MLNEKVIILLIVGLIKKTLSKMSQYFPKPYKSFGGNINVKVNLSNYTTKADLKNAAVIDTSKLAAKSDLASLKADVDKIDVDKLKTVPVDLNKLGKVVNVVKKIVYDRLVTKVYNIDISGFVLKTKYNKDKSNLEKKICDTEKKIPDTIELVKKTDYNTKICVIESKIPRINGLATNSALTTVENNLMLVI